MMSLQQIKKEIQGIKETVKERPLKVLMQTKAKDMTDAEIDRLVQEVPVHQLPTDVLVAVLDREIDKVNTYLGTSYKIYTDITPEHRKILLECWKNEPATNQE